MPTSELPLRFRWLPQKRELLTSTFWGLLLALAIILASEHTLKRLAFPWEKEPPPLVPGDTLPLQPKQFSEKTLVSVPVSFGYRGNLEQEIKQAEFARKAHGRNLAAARTAAQHTSLAEASKLLKGKLSPNSIRISVAEAPSIASGKRVGNQWVCARKNDHPHKSNKNPRGHVDRECCLDPDEIPNPRCSY